MSYRIEWLKQHCEQLYLASVSDEDSPNGYSWEIVGLNEIGDDKGEQVFVGYGATVDEALNDAMACMKPEILPTPPV